MRIWFYVVFIVIIFGLSSTITTASAKRGQWTEIKFDGTALLNQDWFIDIRLTNRTTLLSGYTMSLDGVIVQYEYFQNKPARGTFSIKYTFDSDIVPEGEHEILLILLPFDTSIRPYYYEELYNIVIDVQKTLKGGQFLAMSALILTPFLMMIAYGLLVYKINGDRIENINLINFIPFLISLRQARKDIISHREGRSMNRRYTHYEKKVKEYIRTQKPAGKTAYSMILLFGATILLSIYFFIFAQEIRYQSGYAKLPIINMSIVMGTLFLFISIIPLLIAYFHYTNRYYDEDILLTNPTKFIEHARETAPAFIPLASIDKELEGLDQSVIDIITTREKLEEIFEVKVDELVISNKKKKRFDRNDINTDIDPAQPIDKLKRKQVKPKTTIKGVKR